MVDKHCRVLKSHIYPLVEQHDKFDNTTIILIIHIILVEIIRFTYFNSTVITSTNQNGWIR